MPVRKKKDSHRQQGLYMESAMYACVLAVALGSWFCKNNLADIFACLRDIFGYILLLSHLTVTILFLFVWC